MPVDIPVVCTALTGLAAHRAFTAGRTASVWMGFNLFDFAMFFGAVSLVTAGSTIFRLIGHEWAGGSPAPRLAALACSAVLLADLSDTARGEVGRMWMPFMPLLFVAAWSAPPLDRDSPVLFSQRPRDAIVVGALMLVYRVTLRLHWSF